MLSLIDAAAAVLSAFVLVWGGWWTALSIVALPRPRRPLKVAPGGWHIVAIVPAYNEAGTIGAGLDSLAAAARLAETAGGRAETLVVADNCTDATAAVAAEHGATAIARHDAARRGKGFALEFAVQHLAAGERPPDAVVVIDADTVVEPHLFVAIAARYDGPADAVQVHNAVGGGTSEFTRLRRLQFGLSQWARPLGMQRLGFGTWLKGNGMSLRWALATEVLGGAGIAEDAAMSLELAERGIAVEFEPRVAVHSPMPSDYGTARSQDERWEHGRARLALTSVRTIVRALRRRHFRTATSIAELTAPPLSLLVVVAFGGAAFALLRRPSLLPLHLAASISVVAYVTVGLVAARASLSDIAALRFAPRFIAHKLLVYGRFIGGRSATTWQRTERS